MNRYFSSFIAGGGMLVALAAGAEPTKGTAPVMPVVVQGKIEFLNNTATISIEEDRVCDNFKCLKSGRGLRLSGIQPIANPDLVEKLNRWLKLQPSAVCTVNQDRAIGRCKIGQVDLAYIEVLNGLALPEGGDPVLDRANVVARDTQRGIFALNLEMAR